MKDFIESIRTHVFARLTSPLFGAFAVAWFVTNHRYVVVLFSEGSAEYRFSVAQRLIYPTPVELWVKSLVIPLCVALIYVFLYPFPSRWMTNYLLRQQMKAKEDRDTIEKAMRYTAEESHKVTMDAIATIKDSELRVQQLHTENEKLRKQIADMEVRHADRQSSDQKHIENYRDQAEKLKILQEDTEKQRAILRENLDERTVVADYARSRARELLGRLSKNDNNSKERAPHGPAFWEIIYRLKNSESPLSEDSIRHSVKALVDDVHRSLRVAERDKLVGKKNIDGADHYYLTPLGNEVAEIAPMPDRTGPGG